MRLNRRGFLGGMGAAALALSLPTTALATTRQRAVRTAGTTLDTVAMPLGDSGYRRLTAGPGWPLLVREDLGTGSPGRDDRRTPLASFVQFTDLHLVDAQSPARFEYLHPLAGAGAHRVQETLSALGASSLVQRVNSLASGPYTGRPFDFVVATGDNTDNHELVELDWMMSVLNGGTITPNTGDLSRFEGVQNSGSKLFWNPESPLLDRYKQAGFPQVPGFLAAATRPFTAPGLCTPWYSTFGNHDDSVEGTLPANIALLDKLYTGGVKIEGMDDSAAERLATALAKGDLVTAIAVLTANIGSVREVTADPRRKPFTPAQYIAAHLDPANTGPGPVGHGYRDTGTAYYSFQVAPGVLGISLDSTNPAGWAEGSLSTRQLTWLEGLLKSVSSRYYDADGHLVRGGSGDQHVLIFSHHTSGSMTNLLPDPARPWEGRHSGAELVALLQRFPNVLAWVNGHTHVNRITAHGHEVPERSFWEINTASHCDYPQHARVIELVDNRDGTVSLFTTLIESAAGYRTDFGDLSQAGLAALYRELSFNDLHASATRLGTAPDHNTELILPTPTTVRP
ncbi:TIGR03767 family metallophosphoesterase [Kutzneria albida]|uniref:Uncharacterized protein n=1 Tax=Kutzneria albida DSM 43870 TaxID=1449976 RepID=W5W5H7_9PSEU|nr:TIGR03767 family metallophosphoesterase [Kutzneria albida]AHH93464.1 hypothetical protein KALB_87 [Kutzneria albida DSM 43870]